MQYQVNDIKEITSHKPTWYTRDRTGTQLVPQTFIKRIVQVKTELVNNLCQVYIK